MPFQVSKEQPVRIVNPLDHVLHRLGIKPMADWNPPLAVLDSRQMVLKPRLVDVLSGQPVIPPMESDAMVVQDAEAVDLIVNLTVLRLGIHLVLIRLHFRKKRYGG